MYTNLTSLRLNMDNPEDVRDGSGNPVSPRSEAHTSADGFTEADLASTVPYNSMQEFVADCQDPRYRSDPLDPRPNEMFREECARRLAKYEMVKAANAAAAVPDDDAAHIVSLNPGMEIEIAQAAIKLGGYINSDHEQEGLRAAAKGAGNARKLHEARVTLAYLEGR
jgi:hypothetical protein